MENNLVLNGSTDYFEDRHFSDLFLVIYFLFNTNSIISAEFLWSIVIIHFWICFFFKNQDSQVTFIFVHWHLEKQWPKRKNELLTSFELTSFTFMSLLDGLRQHLTPKDNWCEFNSQQKHSISNPCCLFQ